MKLTDYIAHLELRDGIYYASNKREISYPKEGNDVSFDLEENSFWFKHRNKIITEVIKRYAKNDFFFDIGGGNGYISRAIENTGINTILVEPGIDGCRNAQKRGLKNIICASLEDSHFEEASLPNIGLFDVVEHIEHHVLFLQTVHRYLSPNGYVFITVPAYQALWSNEDNDAGHYRRYTLKSLHRTLAEAGFKPVYSTYIFSLLPLPIFLFRSLPSKLGFHKNSNAAEKYKEEHSHKKGILNKIMNWILEREFKKIKQGRTVRFGSSCFVVAKKI